MVLNSIKEYYIEKEWYFNNNLLTYIKFISIYSKVYLQK
jgi:hypothetical protein